MTNPRALAQACLLESIVWDKLAQTQIAGHAIAAAEHWCDEPNNPPVHRVPIPGRPERPALVAPNQLTQRKLNSIDGRAALIHAVAHIEFNAINLAWDAVYRFPGMPAAYYRDWASVAVDEARHFALLAERLAQLGYAYGDFPAHNGLWQMALVTDHDPLIRMALVPRVLEARGLDVTPGMIDRLLKVGDTQTVAVLQVILAEEVRHVEIGSRWFAYLCRTRNLPAAETFLELVRSHPAARPRLPMNQVARLAAGFDAIELHALQQLAQANAIFSGT